MQTGAQTAGPASDFQLEAERLRSSGALGRSAQLQRLFDFLVRCHAEGHVPKEIEVAMGAFGREAGFDAGQDALVRVHAHKLRRRLEEHYRDESPETACRICLPRGEYRLAVVEAEGIATPDADAVQVGAIPADGRSMPWRGSARVAWALCTVFGLLAVVLLWREWERPRVDAAALSARHSALWAPLLDDDLPVQIVLGDYYIFGERGNANDVQDTSDVQRLIRDFSVNSREDLEQRFLADPALATRYADLNLGYLPTSSAQALRQVLPVITASGKHVSVTLSSELDPSTIKSTHIVYIGYLSALGMLRDIAFAGSRFSFGGSFDELVDHESGQVYASEAGFPRRSDERYRDYAYLSSFVGPGGQRHLLVAGTRDTGLMQAAENAADPVQLAAFAAGRGDGDFETLFEVHGVSGINIESRLVTNSRLTSSAAWAE